MASSLHQWQQCRPLMAYAAQFRTLTHWACFDNPSRPNIAGPIAGACPRSAWSISPAGSLPACRAYMAALLQGWLALSARPCRATAVARVSCQVTSCKVQQALQRSVILMIVSWCTDHSMLCPRTDRIVWRLVLRKQLIRSSRSTLWMSPFNAAGLQALARGCWELLACPSVAPWTCWGLSARDWQPLQVWDSSPPSCEMRANQVRHPLDRLPLSLCSHLRRSAGQLPLLHAGCSVDHHADQWVPVSCRWHFVPLPLSPLSDSVF